MADFTCFFINLKYRWKKYSEMLNNIDNEIDDISFEAELDWGFNGMLHLMTPNRGGGK